MSGASIVLPLPQATDLRGRRALRKTLLSALRLSESPVIVDLTGYCTLDHDAVDLILECVAQSVGHDAALAIVAGSQPVRIVLEVTRVSSLVRVFSSLEDAMSDSQVPVSNVDTDSSGLSLSGQGAPNET
jgi:anti-anti-sigma regulatory factor